MYIGDWLARRAMLSPSKIALIDATDGGRPITYREWNRAANRTAHFLRAQLGVGKGDRVMEDGARARKGVLYTPPPNSEEPSTCRACPLSPPGLCRRRNATHYTSRITHHASPKS
jgi:hypothetical protein